jgi:hypothetical protein
MAQPWVLCVAAASMLPFTTAITRKWCFSSQPDIAPIFYQRLIDNAYIIQRNTPHGYTPFMQAMNAFGQEGARLKWESPGPGCAVNFLDFNIQINQDGSLTTSTFQKLMSIYLFRPPASAQPPSILYELIYGALNRLFSHKL